jgi:glycosyltransferase involved in cell wall biosynthesis
MLSEMTASLVQKGWEVTVLTGPAEGAPASERTGDGVRVERVGAASFTRESLWRRAWAYLSLYPAFLVRALRLPRPDVVVTKTDPPMLKVLGPVLGRLTGARTVHWAQDLYPEVAEEAGVIEKGGVLAEALRRLSTAALRGHDEIVAVGRCMNERMVARRLRGDAISVVPNWPPSTVEPVPHEDNPFRREHDLDDRFVVMYSGNMGLAHPFGPVLDAAERLQNERPDVEFLLVGEGPRKAALKRRAARRNLANVRFLPFQPRERLAESLSAADLHLVTMEETMEGLVVPSKLYGVLAAGRPALFLGPGGSEAARVIEEHECGTVLPAVDGAGLSAAIRSWYDAPEALRDASQRAREAVGGARADAVDAFDRLLRG